MIPELPLKGVLGLGKASTLYYLAEIQKKYQEMNHEFSTSPLLLYQIDFQEINPFLPNNFEVLIPQLKNYFSQIYTLGISKLLVPNITLHESLDQMELAIKICHPIDLTIQYLQRKNISKVYLFGTLYTMNSEYLKDKFSKNDISLLKPTEKDQYFINDFRKEVYKETQTPNQVLNFQNLIRRYSGENLIVIACTELSIFSLKVNPPCIDMMDLQIEEFLR